MTASPIQTNTIKLAYADACKSGVDSWLFTDIWEGFRNKGTSTFIGFNRDVYTSETNTFTNYFGYYLKGGWTVNDAAYRADQRAGMNGAYTVYGDGNIKI
ncbi:MAG: hypothetical protein MPEBLZ_00560 [Candidatus Methanoperedens nitroreducens]|uniref:Uncharacterized protein n=1 Tax=Candidatus Methanoperedens nitratireducens TaxID=1392998 RepID=A0A0P8E381_9EURY|nr:hypothetical protein [Candidatus Methanoperedens sp. BLZ2]KAB2942125.1 MAG: hypothetical protein F9K14_17545 [Candidatus Methanoperedens sp.]KPQ44881.1 MAG: hypothetical protein MPEBLZ_00560 [Candidatus Methanoperedens sp. BLZ1]MBZ0177162.1 hypothetical protein [Candidatus Methanoperedens nitroreducens]CAG0979205.1 hypothetical protein METP2_01863 [Methanosarcinales archaeon]MCX9078834.1 hypothetical protein [Candidatus Methanoperedens sp.]